jgi:hypothetical protein
MGDALPPVDLGANRTAKVVVGGMDFTCVLMDNDQLRCFGDNLFGMVRAYPPPPPHSRRPPLTPRPPPARMHAWRFVAEREATHTHACHGWPPRNTLAWPATPCMHGHG